MSPVVYFFNVATTKLELHMCLLVFLLSSAALDGSFSNNSKQLTSAEC